MSREFKAPKRITIELTDAEERFYRAEHKRLGLDKDIGGWIPGAKESMIKKIVKAADNKQPSDSEKIVTISIVMDDWLKAPNEIIIRDLKQILGM